MDYIAAALGNIWQRREKITKGFKIVSEAPIMRHFTVELERA
jgi:tryptophanase